MWTRRRARWLIRLAAASLLAAGVVGLTGVPAQAHASLVSTTPGNGERLDSPPEEIVLRFTERVSIPERGVQLREPAGGVVATGEAVPGEEPGEVRLPVPADLPQGSYLVTFRVVSADSHPVAGGFVFGVGVDAQPLSDIDLDLDDDPVLAAVFTASRWVSYAGLALLAGAMCVFALCWPGGWANRRARQVVLAGWVASLTGGVAVLLLQGPYTAGAPVSGLFDPDLLAATMDTDYGRYVLARLGLVVLAGALILAGPGWRTAVRRAGALLVGVALPVTWVGTGHANTAENPLEVVAEVVHLVAMSAWFGGLALLAICLLPRSSTVPAAEVAGVLRRFSLLATGSVITLVATGVYIAWRQVGSLDNLLGTPYGRLLAVKLATIGLLVWFGAMSRSVVQRRYAHPEPVPAGAPAAIGASRSKRRASKSAVEEEQRARGQLRQSVRLEVGTAMAVLVVASLLVATPPGAVASPEAVGPRVPQPIKTEVTIEDDALIEVMVDPALTGENRVTLQAWDRANRPLDLPEVRVALVLPEQDLGPLPVELEQIGVGQYAADTVPLPLPGAWRLDLTVRTSEIDSSTVSIDVPVA